MSPPLTRTSSHGESRDMGTEQETNLARLGKLSARRSKKICLVQCTVACRLVDLIRIRVKNENGLPCELINI